MKTKDRDLFWENVFQFPSNAGRCESLVWRKYAVAIDETHDLGCNKQASDRAQGRDRSVYFGAITGNAGEIRSLRSTRGIGLVIDHVPAEGIFHAHLGFSPGSEKNDRTELKAILRLKFGEVEGHQCPDGH
jgi:hypothetical protein